MQTTELRPLMARLAPMKVIDAQRTQPSYEVAVQDIRWDEPGEIRVASGPLCLIELSNDADTPAPGRAIYRVELNNHQERPVGRLNFLPPEAERTVRWTAGSRQAVVCVMEPQRLGLLAGMVWRFADIDPQLTLDVKNDRLCTLMHWLAEEARSPSFASELQTASLMTLLAIELHQHCMRGRATADPGPVEGRLSPRQLQIVMDLVASCNNTAGPSLDELAQACQLAARELSTLFHHTMGQTLRSYVAESHIARARLLLADPDLLVKQVAYRSGFRSAAAFGEAFRRATGLTPLQYRHKLGLAGESVYTH